jgi:prepilin-type N-terminal cleavage/methylation domain-containing protein
MQIGAFPIQETTMHNESNAIRAGFSLIELVIVVAIMAVIATISIPRFTDSASGRRLQAARDQLLSDIEVTKLRAISTSKQHTVKFYVDRELYVIVEGNEVTDSAVIIARDLSESPLNSAIRRTNLGGDHVMVITPFGDLSPSGIVRLEADSALLDVTLEGIADTGAVPVITSTADEVEKLIVDDVLGGVFEALGGG